MRQQKHCDKQEGNDPGPGLDLFVVTAETADYNVRDQTEGNAVGNAQRVFAAFLEDGVKKTLPHPTQDKARSSL